MIGTPQRRQPLASPGGWRPRLGLWRYTVYLTPDEHAALISLAGGYGHGEGPLAAALARIIDEGLSNAMIGEGG